MEDFCLEIEDNENISVKYIAYILESNFPIPDIQAEQIAFILKNKKKIKIFSKYPKEDLERFSKYLNNIKISNRVILNT